jgi:hypothetical protein
LGSGIPILEDPALKAADNDFRQRIVFLGAGFSAPAGLPLTVELGQLAVEEAERVFGHDTQLTVALEEYTGYLVATSGQPAGDIDIESLLTYLDYRHSFGLLGKDTWPAEANIDQMMLRWAIGRVLHRRTPSLLPECYARFAEQLRGKDVVVTFNYDLIVEKCLTQANVPFRRFPTRLKSVGTYGGEVDWETGRDEVILVKLHGSLDWVSEAPHADVWRARSFDEGEELRPVDRDPIFGEEPVSRVSPLIDGLSFDNDPLRDVYALSDLDNYYSHRSAYMRPPLIMAPSSAKAVYGRELRPLWRGIGLNGSNWGGLSLIGLSLRPADDYLRQVLYTLTSDYTWNFQEGKGWGRPGRIRIIDRRTPESAQALKDAFRFIEWEYVELDAAGFTSDSIDPLFLPPGPLWES